MTTTDTTLADLLRLDRHAQDLLFREARTANTFTDEPVTDEQVRAIHDLVQWAPTSMNSQPLRVLLVRSDEARARLLPHMAEGNRAKTGAAPLVAVLAADHDFHEQFHRTFPHFPGAKGVFADDEVRAGAATLNGTLQVAYFILGVRAAGLAAGPMTGYDAAGIDAEFFAGTDRHVLAVVNVGHPGEDAWFPRSPRLGYDEVVTTV
ncbi:putative NADH dehydrogenase/NAD(P)H nitroreductase [Angustibacter aerolatus]|uniref:NADH dehydrogenase/NAD(P)H nitroreductase n=1 Tax=Angustibacter aerolatus TaxID=1162965 RepID=A0ABQ6JG10_9ACTN|nr:malonic semialdehyde reductase [Angustibacter aerolatus]GMA86358.1 putative NADH dehydrogenase/NAD(P)H nitroreductase [Angustibacter aerolatus]